MERNVPEYVSASVPVPLTARVPWYKSTFPSYFGIFLFVGYYLKLSGPTLGYASVSVSLLGLLVAGLLCFGLYYYVPAMLGMQTGRNLYVVGSSTFGTTGGFLIPGILMGLLQVGWVAVDGTLASHFIMQGLNQTSRTLYSVIVIVWLYSLGMGSYQRTQLRQRVRQVHELGSVRHDADRTVDQPQRHPPLPASAA